MEYSFEPYIKRFWDLRKGFCKNLKHFIHSHFSFNNLSICSINVICKDLWINNIEIKCQILITLAIFFKISNPFGEKNYVRRKRDLDFGISINHSIKKILIKLGFFSADLCNILMITDDGHMLIICIIYIFVNFRNKIWYLGDSMFTCKF